MSKQAIKNLSCACVDIKPRNIDWGGDNIMGGKSSYDFDDTGEGWKAWSAEMCEECDKHVVLEVGAGGDSHRTFEHERGEKWCDGHLPMFEGPAMNYFYPIDGELDPREAALTIADLPLCIVRLGDEWGLALTGGGMDLSWQICEAYMRLGFLPPTHFEPPAMAGRGKTARDRWIIAGYRRACMVQTGWLRSKLRATRAIVAQRSA